MWAKECSLSSRSKQALRVQLLNIFGINDFKIHSFIEILFIQIREFKSQNPILFFKKKKYQHKNDKLNRNSLKDKIVQLLDL